MSETNWKVQGSSVEERVVLDRVILGQSHREQAGVEEQLYGEPYFFVILL